MEIFYNSSAPGYEEIVSYGPKWWTEYKEMDAVYMFEGWILDILAKKMEQEVRNIFPSQADYPSLIKYEKMLHIEHDEESSFEDRRRIVQAYYSGTGKLSESVIKSIVKMYGDCDCELWWKDKSCLQIRIFCDDDKTFFNKQIYQIIERRFPAHLLFTVRNAVCRFETKEIINFFKVKYRVGFSWWNDTLDGKYKLDGKRILNANFPPLFKSFHRIRAETDAKFDYRILQTRFSCEISSKANFVEQHRISLNWWNELETLDGEKNLDGAIKIDQVLPPSWNIEAHRMEVLNEEKFSVAIYIPSMAKKLDGDVMLNGTIKLNYGKETL